MALDLSRDWEVIDDLISVTYVQKESRIDFAEPVTIRNVYIEEVEKQQVTMSGGDLAILPARVTYIHIWRMMLDEVSGSEQLTPKPHDVVKIQQEAGGGLEVFTIESVEQLDRDSNGVQRYRCRIQLVGTH